MPLVHFFAVILTAGQGIFYLQLDKNRAKFISLFSDALTDLGPFMVIFFLIIAVHGILLHVLGNMFDSGGNYDQHAEPYDASHNDYYLMNYLAAMIAANLRNGIADLQSPSPNYWHEQYAT